MQAATGSLLLLSSAFIPIQIHDQILLEQCFAIEIHVQSIVQ